MPEIGYLPFSDIDWEDIIDTLEGEKCILFIGPEAYLAPGGKSLDTGLLEWLDATNKDHPQISAIHQDGFLQFRKNRKSHVRKVAARIRDFYSQPFPETQQLFSKLAEIPFTMCFTMLPDNLMARTFDQKGLDYQPGYYSIHRVRPESEWKVSSKEPLLYNILGNIEDPESLILTQTDFFEYLEQIVSGKHQVEPLLHELEKAERFIFLGLPYEKWQFQLLMRVLSMHTEKMGTIERMGFKEFEDPRLHTLFKSDFKIDFIPDTIDRFVEELHNRCKEEGLIRKGPPPDPRLANMPDPDLNTVKQLLRDGETDEALLQMEVFLDRKKPASKQLIDIHILLNNRFSLLRQRIRKMLITESDAVVEENQIAHDLLDLTNQTEKQFPG